jgi:hypothetical protein
MGEAGHGGGDGRLGAARVAIGLLLLAPVAALLWVPSYTRLTPKLLGFPFFYWYQLAWVLGGAACLAGAYVLTMRLERQRRAARR